MSGGIVPIRGDQIYSMHEDFVPLVGNLITWSGDVRDGMRRVVDILGQTAIDPRAKKTLPDLLKATDMVPEAFVALLKATFTHDAFLWTELRKRPNWQAWAR